MMLTVHIGYTKTASTTLQHFFPRHPDVRFLGKHYLTPEADQEIRVQTRAIAVENSLDFDPDILLSLITREREQAADKKALVFSDEKLLHSPDIGRSLDRVFKSFAPDRVMFSIREQRKWIVSRYRTRSRLTDTPRCHYGRFIPMEDWLEHTLAKGHNSELWHARYLEAARYCEERLGRENVGLFLFEEMIKDQETYTRKLCDFIGVPFAPEHVSLLSRTHKNKGLADRWMNKQLFMHELRKRGSLLARSDAVLRLAGALYSNLHRTSAPMSSKVAIPEQWMASIEDMYRESNRELARAWDLPLERYGYIL